MHAVQLNKGWVTPRSPSVLRRTFFNLHHVLGGPPPSDHGTQRFKEKVVLPYVFLHGRT